MPLKNSIFDERSSCEENIGIFWKHSTCVFWKHGVTPFIALKHDLLSFFPSDHLDLVDHFLLLITTSQIFIYDLNTPFVINSTLCTLLLWPFISSSLPYLSPQDFQRFHASRDNWLSHISRRLYLLSSTWKLWGNKKMKGLFLQPCLLW